MEYEKSTTGTVASDPVASMPVGGKVHFQSSLMTYTPPTMSAWIRDWESLDGTLLAISFADADFHSIEGSAVVVAPGIALCAWHVLEARINALAAGHEAITCFGITADGLQIWRVRKITMVPNSDLAILGLELASQLNADATLYQSVVTTRFPKIGERVTIFGFRAAQEQYKRNTTEKPSFSGNLLVCAGEVVQRFPTGRDRIMMPWPALEVACPSWGGMSGGPVFDSNGKVLGLLSTSFTTDASEGPSFVALLLPALTTRFEGGWPGPVFNDPKTLIELDPRLFPIDGREAISAEKDQQTGKSVTVYKMWE